jgi:hypothetical protein
MARSRFSSTVFIRAGVPSGATPGVFVSPDPSSSLKEGILGALGTCGTPSSRDLRGFFLRDSGGRLSRLKGANPGELRSGTEFNVTALRSGMLSSVL